MPRGITIALCLMFVAAQLVCAPLCASASTTKAQGAHSCCGDTEQNAKNLPTHGNGSSCSLCSSVIHSEKSQSDPAPSAFLEHPIQQFLLVQGFALSLDTITHIPRYRDHEFEQSHSIIYQRIASQAAPLAPPV